MNTSKMNRLEMFEALQDRDGPNCFLCKKPFIVNEQGEHISPGQEKTIDHWYPQSFLFAQGKSYEEIWDLSNLRLAHKQCNAKKGDLIPVDDVTVPTRQAKVPTTRAAKRANRSEICHVCDSGRKVAYGENCGACGSGPMPEIYPQYAKANANECDHELFWCWACSIGIVTRKAAVITVLDGEFLDE